MGGEEQKPNTKGTDPMKRSYRILTGKATSKSEAEQAAGLAALQGRAKHSLEQLSATMGLKMLDLMLSAEIQERTGERGQQVPTVMGINRAM
jgi:hypothetical protein